MSKVSRAATALVQQTLTDLQNQSFEAVHQMPVLQVVELPGEKIESLATTVKHVSDDEVWVMVEAWWPVWFGKRSIGRGLVFTRDQGVRDASENELSVLENQ